MKTILNITLSVIVILLYPVKFASSIFCYDCNSAFDPRCGEEFDSFSLGIVNCSLRDPPEHIPPVEPTICRSIKMEINGKVRIVRQCGYLTDEDHKESPCRRIVGTGDLFVTYCSCNTDLCNGTSSNNTPQLILFLMFLFNIAAFIV